MSQQEKKNYQTTTSKRASEISEITPATTTSNETTLAPVTTSKSTVTSKSKVQHMKEQYKNFKVPDSYLEQQKDLHHNLDLYDDNPSLETENHKLRAIIANLRNKNMKLEKTNVDISKKLKSLKEDFSTLMEINDAFGTENEKLKRKIRASEIDDIESKHLSKKAKGKRSVVQISDDDNKDEDVDDDLMDSKSNATEESPEEPNKREARKKLRRIKAVKDLFNKKNSRITSYGKQDLLKILANHAYHSPEVSETEDEGSKSVINVYDLSWRSKELRFLLRNVLNKHLRVGQTA
ncbi:hypothetical protein GLOIN_2v1770886 [Rhizophagus irregularis DAOM 181602=DAOM 197198]|uniref:Uncharacterized protein n=1 Tax=Rhizophagus irregularis (strain DAOM 181602 / DAOM 197198 / MUCL 43194) TaxID=747089 RepID=A0A2P4QB43_RHIID|nr:hypothetical protein GLOIN_2v1770886 [Rhizophagus irregularis DAOM 181602=DAOM 197198]POG74836.1 hypothetical protein GLOIN_2v1770886 [Rhizophagus irregularis DAOM 181602=DAOM 197198]|eukprot:XP_025181702.1 hypothetical protein GLOIN_2v1770886 [Rhizophagus irregularis DAOM 181602=DAOM 197198]